LRRNRVVRLRSGKDDRSEKVKKEVTKH
jgi:hypothetical protein